MPLNSSGSGARLRRLALVAAATVPLVATAVHVPALAAGHGAKGPAKVIDTPTSAHRVTLVTGDVVTVTTLADGKQTADVRRPVDAVGGVRMQERDGDLYVIPDEAVGLLGTDKLDPRLFDVTSLIKMGYGDSRTKQIPMIASYTRAATKVDATPSAPHASRVSLRLPAVRSSALTAPKPSVRAFWNSVAPAFDPSDPTPTLDDGISKLWLDGKVRTTLHESVPQIGAPEAWADGYDGTGVTVALLDTGLDVNHPDLSTQVAGTQSFVPGETIADVNGHGTHVGSTIAGTGAAQAGYYKGVAPGAKLDVGKVMDATGQGQDSWVMAGMEWAAQKGDRIVNMSLGDSSFVSDGTDPMAQEVDALSAQYGTLFVIASGNNGPQTVTSPGTASSALTVGAVDKQDSLAWFSSGGPVAGASGAIKPDLVAPGVDITAAKSEEMGDGSTDLYRALDGTSMATPHVAGSAAILAEEHPLWTGQKIKEQLMSSAKGLDGYTPFDVGTGRVDVAAAVEDTLRATPSLSFGNYLWPHDPSQVSSTKDLTFTNDGDQDVTLDLALDGTDDAFSLSDSTVTVPAGGKSTVQVTGDPQAAPIGTDAGFVVGTDAATGDPVTRTSVALLKEDERYDLTLSVVDRDGQPAAGWVAFNQAGSDLGAWGEYVDGSKTLRMPAGDYSVTTYLDVKGEGADRSGLAVLVDPEIQLDQSRDVVLDARAARLLQTTAPQRSEDRQRKVDLSIVDSTGLEFRSAYEVPPMVDDIYVSPTAPVTEGSFLLTTRWRKGAPMLSLGTPSGSATFPTLVQPGSSLGTRTDTVATVYAGDGAAADYQGVDAHGKIAVVERSDDVTPDARAAAAAAAGALALVVVNDGVGGLNEYVGAATLPVASVHRDAGAALIALAQQGKKLTATQTKYTPFVYDLTREYPGHVPDQPLVYHPTKKDLARIDARYYAVRPGQAAGYRYDVTLSPSLGYDELERHPGTRVEWVTPGQQWVESHAQNINGALPWPMVSGVNTYHLGKTVDLDWFRPAVRPGFSDSFGVYNSRWQDFMTWNVQDWSSYSSNMRLGGFLPWGETPTMLHVYQGKKLIHTNKYSSDMQWEAVPPGNRPYRVVLDAGRPAGVFRLSTHTHTQWTFMSDTVAADNFEPFAVMKLDYRLATDLEGDVRAGRTQHIAVRPASSTTQSLPGKLTHVTLGVSANGGKAWHAVRLTKGSGGWWHGSFQAANKPGGYLSVRANATMNSGYSIKQEITRAYGLR
jgi:subtilisin family serine protease